MDEDFDEDFIEGGMQVKISEVMTTDIATATIDTTLEDIANMMRAENVGAIPILDDEGDLAGILTDRDIVVRCIADGKDATETTAEDVLSYRVDTISPEQDTSAAARLMARRQIRRLPVVDKGKLVGMVSLGDLAVKTQDDREIGDTLEEVSQGVKQSSRGAREGSDPESQQVTSADRGRNGKDRKEGRQSGSQESGREDSGREESGREGTGREGSGRNDKTGQHRQPDLGYSKNRDRETISVNAQSGASRAGRTTSDPGGKSRKQYGSHQASEQSSHDLNRKGNQQEKPGQKRGVRSAEAPQGLKSDSSSRKQGISNHRARTENKRNDKVVPFREDNEVRNTAVKKPGGKRRTG